MKVKQEPKKEKDTKLQTKPPSKAGTRKTSNSLSPSKKEKNSGSAADVRAAEPVENQLAAPRSEKTGSNEETHPPASCNPANKVFQRTLSPADVLHVHSYAKGDYGDGDAPLKEEKKSESSDSQTEKDNRHVSKSVSASTSLHCRVAQQQLNVTHVDGGSKLSNKPVVPKKDLFHLSFMVQTVFNSTLEKEPEIFGPGCGH